MLAVIAAITLLLPAAIRGQLSCSNPAIDGTCPYSLGGFHVICGTFNWDEAANACEALGLRIAQLDDANAMQALLTLRQCALLGTNEAWVGSWNGLGADPCAYLDVNGAVVMNPGYEQCNSGVLKLAICEAKPFATAIFTRNQITPLITGVTTTTTTQCAECGTTTAARMRNKALDGDDADLLLKANQDKQGRRKPCGCDRSKPESCRRNEPLLCPVGPCVPVCPFSTCGLHVVQGDNMTFADAQEECAKYGWNLADITNGQLADVAFLQGYCGREAAGRAFWIRSFDGVSGALCVKVLQANSNGMNTPIAFAVDPFYCDQQALPYALCQDAPVQPTGTGVWVGPRSFISSEFYTFQTTLTIPSSTQTVTVTKYWTAGCQY